MKKESQIIKNKVYPVLGRGFSIIEVILAVSILGLIVTMLFGALYYGEESTTLAGLRNRAIFAAEEGIEAVRSIRDNSFSGLLDGNYGLSQSGSVWAFDGTSETNGPFSRVITIETADANTKSVTSNVTWKQTEGRDGSITILSRMTNWQALSATEADSLLVDISGARVDPSNNKRVIGITFGNQGQSDIKIIKMTVSWSGAQNGTRIRKININNNIVWNGNAADGTLLDIADAIIPSSSAYLLNYLEFNKNITGAIISIIFTMNDGTNKTVSGISI